jgi:hypothetical protein
LSEKKAFFALNPHFWHQKLPHKPLQGLGGRRGKFALYILAEVRHPGGFAPAIAKAVRSTEQKDLLMVS